MEQKSNSIIMTVTNTIDPIPDNNKMKQVEKKKRRAMHLVQVALYMLRMTKKPKSLHVDVASKGMWKRLVSSMRPLHLQSNQTMSPPPSVETQSPMVSSPLVEHYEDVLPSPTASSSSSSDDSMSRYASAVNLPELDKSNNDDDDDDDDEDDASYGGDEMIDVKAEEFIAHFYEQMKLQRMASADRRYHEMTQRSIN
jgi:hypothetical protein